MKDNELTTLDDLKEKLVDYDWLVDDISFSDDSVGWEISKHSPAGEDFFFDINHNGNLSRAIDEIVEYAKNGFDKDENIEMWIEAKKNGVRGVPSIRELVQDADDIQDMLDDLREYVQSFDIQKFTEMDL